MKKFEITCAIHGKEYAYSYNMEEIIQLFKYVRCKFDPKKIHEVKQ
jgi:hypothetical protein